MTPEKSGAPPTFFRSLVFISLLAVLTLPFYTIFFLSPSFVKYITSLKEKQAIRLAAHMESKLIPDQSIRLSQAILTEDVLKKIVGTSRDFNLAMVRILYPDGKILFSLDESEADGTIHIDRIAPRLRNGETHTDFYKKGALDHEGQVMGGEMVDTHVPIMRDSTLIGFFEIYYDITEDHEKLTGLLKRFYFTLIPIALILLCSVIVSCRRASGNISKRLEAEEQLLQQSRELEEKNLELTELIDICQDRKLKLEEEQQARQQAQEQLHSEMEKREQQRKEFLRHTVMTQEDERSRIARELHDETAQTLTAASLNFATLKNKLEGNFEVADVVDRLQNLCKQMNQDLYRLVHDLRPAQLDDLGLVPALNYLANEGQNNSGIEVSLNVSGKVQRMSPFVETVVFRIVQEALTNVTRHAETDKAWVDLDFQDDFSLILRIRDKGKGFDSQHQQECRTGWGLVGISERIESINGTLTIDSSPGMGTTVQVIIPVLQQTTLCPPPERL